MPIKVNIQKEKRLTVTAAKKGEIAISLGNIIIEQSNAEEYDGEYRVIPQAFHAQTLDSANKIMREDVTVAEIPYFAVSNEEGGKTVIIGG